MYSRLLVSVILYILVLIFSSPKYFLKKDSDFPNQDSFNLFGHNDFTKIIEINDNLKGSNKQAT